MIAVIGITLCLTATLFAEGVDAGDQNTNEHHNENNTETQNGMDNNDNGETSLNQQRAQSRPTNRGT